MVVIRLMRTGKIHDPHYRIVVQEKRSKLNGLAIDTLGHYHPAQKEKQLVIDADKAKAWMSKGAQPSDTVINLFVKQGILAKDKKVHNFFTPKKVEVVPEAPKEEVVAEVVAEEVAPEEPVAEPEEAVEETATEEKTEEAAA